ncbi:bacillithiol system redox-active protein YtxJ [Flavobacterium terrae]|uniref:Bacillithiol system protein YtxJ n=1 Tax=Flavobacterium terrae TaxID=415425 RepID=A0A1M6F597_9FLAO|nr:bacillithiol system redox-active protein YtxJ [Flavobacterium terrae]SHI92875.1 bacillithiol system protein YtxJ [Flavobacterium terrae]
MSFLKNIFGNNEPQKEESKMEWFPLNEINQLDEIIAESKENPVLIFKHSTRCIISRTVLKNFEKKFDLEGKVKPYFLDLLEFRPISNEIASLFNVTHQSPQLILVKDGKAIYNASHDNIEVKDLKNYI